MTINILICALLWASHILTKWNEAFVSTKAAGAIPPGFIEFCRGILPSVLLSIAGTIGAFLMVLELGWMNAGMAGACGYMGSSLTKKIVDQFQSKLPS